jgi:hypothetical protein
MPDDIPFTTFVGQLKQLETTFQLPIMQELFEPCFAAFRELDEHYAWAYPSGFVTAAGVEHNFGYRPRRFSGGPGLPSGRYFTLCDGGDFNDRGTLRDELTAYYSETSGMTVTIFDPKVDVYICDHLKSTAGLTEEDLAQPFFNLLYRIERRTPGNAALFDREEPFKVGKAVGVTYGIRQVAAEIDRIIDLRDPETQAWFVKTFVTLELQNEARAGQVTALGFPPKSPIESFSEMLPVIVSLEIGGGMIFSQAIGLWLRQHGAKGLIFPSARSNAFSRVRNDRKLDCGGWILVLYSGAGQPLAINLFGRMMTWRDRDHDHIRVNYTAVGEERGSFSIRGVREFNLLAFDEKKQIACGLHERDLAALYLGDVLGTRNAARSRLVNSLLDREHELGRLWYNDVDYISFLAWHERRWREHAKRRT